MSVVEGVSEEEKGLRTPGDTKHPNQPRWAWAVLAGLVTYQAVMYGWVMRVIMSLSVVLMPWLLRRPDYRLYENAILPYAPGGLWFGALLYGLCPAPLLRVRLLMIVVATLSTGLVFWLARRWWGVCAGLMAAGVYALWGPVVMDHLMYLEVWLGLLTVGALAVWHETGLAGWRPLLAGLLVGLAVLVKQHGLAVVVVFVIWRALGLADWRAALTDMLRFGLGVVLPVGVVLLVLGAQGRLDDALFWMFGFSLGPYLESAGQHPLAREWAVLVAWLALVLLFAAYVVPRREQWQREGILLLGLVAALCVPAFPRYGRFHLSGAVPVVALAGAGALHYAQGMAHERRGLMWRALRSYGLGAAGLLTLLALALPTYYRLKLGPLTGEYEALVPISDWVAEETGADPGTRVWMLPDIDPTANFYAVSGYLPPAFWVQNYGWLHAMPGLTESFVGGLEADPPQYAVLIEKWRPAVPEELLAYLDAHYAPLEQAEMPYGMGAVMLYRLEP